MTSNTIGAFAGIALFSAVAAACSEHPQQIHAVAPIVIRGTPPAPLAKPVEPTPVAEAPTQSKIAIADEIRVACGIPAEDAYFDFDSAKIRQEYNAVLNKLATCFSTGPLAGRTMVLVGHCDPRGDAEYNMLLGEHRADSVKHFIEGRGLAASQMETSSRGEMDATGTNEATWALDRRVDVMLAPKKTPTPEEAAS